MNTTPPDECPSWAALAAHAARWRDRRIASAGAPWLLHGAGIELDLSKHWLDPEALAGLVALARERDLSGWRDAMLAGEAVNPTEARAAWHTALRAGDAAPGEVKQTLARMASLASEVRNGGRVKRIIHLGIGGSVLGPRLALDALASRIDAPIAFDFAANVDPVELDRALAAARPEETLFVVVSKTFTTQETLANARAAKAWLGSRAPEWHFVAVTSNPQAARELGIAPEHVLPMPDWVGGRFSLWSAAGFTVMCALGEAAFRELLAGARQMDRHFATAPLEANLPVVLGLLDAWYANFHGAETRVVLPYAHALRLLPAWLQQLEMESNGKLVDREGRPVGYATAPVVWGGAGTVSQHSFHQQLHQGTYLVPAEFVVVREPMGSDAERHAMLVANARAQAEALAFGTADDSLPAHRRHPGNRPSGTITLERLDPHHLGRLLALCEHRAFVAGTIWNVNSFDQWGVELGKQLAREILSRRA
jgi:glucose-6-phosphate isomerase